MKNLIIAAALLLPMGACATVTKGTDDTVNLITDPPGATATITDVTGKLAPVTCTTPCRIELNRKRTYGVAFEMDGFEVAEGMLEPKLSGDGAAGMAGNILIGGIIGAGVDAATGAMNDLKPNPLAATLVPVGTIEVIEASAETEPAPIVEAAGNVTSSVEKAVDATLEAADEAGDNVGEVVSPAT